MFSSVLLLLIVRVKTTKTNKLSSSGANVSPTQLAAQNHITSFHRRTHIATCTKVVFQLGVYAKDPFSSTCLSSGYICGPHKCSYSR